MRCEESFIIIIMISAPGFLSDGHATNQRQRHSSAHRLTRSEKLIAEFLQEHPKSSTFDVVLFLCPNFNEQPVCARTTLWGEVSAMLARMLARGFLELEVHEIQLARWSLDPASPVARAHSRGR